MAEKCTWLIEPASWVQGLPEEDGDDSQPHVCGKRAIVAYTKRNPRAREPDQPEVLRYPRCKTHGTNDARRVAPAQGFDIQEIES